MNKKIRVRFAPSPTGFMHLGNVRAALMNYLYAKKNHGTFILRIEDTDQERHVEEAVDRITQDLAWLGLTFTEGPYSQSQRQALYQEQLDEMAGHGHVYRCFCSKEILEEMRDQQRSAGQPPRYDRRCAAFSADRIKRKVEYGLPFIWRFKLNDKQSFDLHDLAKGTITFDMSHFSDFAVTREDGSFTFLFTNFVDDALMNISHVIRGEDHLSNTALQLAMYHAIAHKAPIYWHLPLICNQNGEKMSKRDFGFNLTDLKEAGFLPEAINNYLAIIGKSFEHEIMSLEELAREYDFNHVGSASSIKYDREKLDWVNEQWIQKLHNQEILERIKPFIGAPLSSITNSTEKLLALIALVKPGSKTLKELVGNMTFYWQAPVCSYTELAHLLSSEDAIKIAAITDQVLDKRYEKTTSSTLQVTSNNLELLELLKKESKTQNIGMKQLLTSLRFALTGQEKGIGVLELFELFSQEELYKRVHNFFKQNRHSSNL